MENEPIYEYEKRLDSIKSARQFMSAAIVAYDQGRIDSDKLSTLSTAFNTLTRLLEKSELADRIEALEDLINKGAAA